MRDTSEDAQDRRLYGLAAAQGHAEAQFNLGHMHRVGEGGPEDFAEARRLFGLAAAQGGPYPDPNPNPNPNSSSEPNTNTNPTRTLTTGNANAQNNLGLMLRNSQGGPQDLAEARRLYKLAAAQGNPNPSQTL